MVIQYTAQPGSHVNRGDVVAEVEASKSVFDISTPVAGEITELFVQPGASISVGKPLSANSPRRTRAS